MKEVNRLNELLKLEGYTLDGGGANKKLTGVNDGLLMSTDRYKKVNIEENVLTAETLVVSKTKLELTHINVLKTLLYNALVDGYNNDIKGIQLPLDWYKENGDELYTLLGKYLNNTIDNLPQNIRCEINDGTNVQNILRLCSSYYYTVNDICFTNLGIMSCFSNYITPIVLSYVINELLKDELDTTKTE